MHLLYSETNFISTESCAKVSFPKKKLIPYLGPLIMFKIKINS